MFRNLSISIYVQCEDRCVREKECVSVNIGPIINDKLVCELSDSDHLLHPQALQPRQGWIYRGTEVRILHNANFFMVTAMMMLIVMAPSRWRWGL